MASIELRAPAIGQDECNSAQGIVVRALWSDEVAQLYKSEAGFDAIMSWYKDLIDKIDIPFDSCLVDTRFGRTHMLVCGSPEAPPLILVQAIAGSAPLWRKQLKDFAQHFRVYALDTVGQPGWSDPNPMSYVNDDYVRWLTDIMDGLGIERAHFAGISAGGWQVMRMAIEEPDRVDRIVMLSPIGVCRARLPIRIWLTKILRQNKSADALEKDLTAKSVASPSPGGSFGTFDRQLARAMALCTRHFRLDRSLDLYDRGTGKIRIGRALKVLRRFFLSEPRQVLKNMKRPGLVIFGQHEILYKPQKVGSKLENLMVDVRVHVMEGAGHAAIYDRPAETNDMIIDFLRA